MKMRDHSGDLVEMKDGYKTNRTELAARVWDGYNWFKQGWMQSFWEHGNEHKIFLNGG